MGERGQASCGRFSQAAVVGQTQGPVRHCVVSRKPKAGKSSAMRSFRNSFRRATAPDHLVSSESLPHASHPGQKFIFVTSSSCQRNFDFCGHHYRMTSIQSCVAASTMIRGMQLRRRALQGTLWPEWPPADEVLVWIINIPTSPLSERHATNTDCSSYRPGKRRRREPLSAWTSLARDNRNDSWPGRLPPLVLAKSAAALRAESDRNFLLCGEKFPT